MTELLNRNGRPWGVPRMHVNKHGIPKPARTDEAESLARAIELTLERARDPRWQQRRLIPIESYRCDVCSLWHEGSAKRNRRFGQRGTPALFLELGDRAFWNLNAENLGSPPKRLRYFVRMAQRPALQGAKI